MHNNQNKFITFNLINLENMIKNISKYTKKPIHLFIYGGEPVLHPDILNILKKLGQSLKKYNMSFGKDPIMEIQSNLSFKIEKYIEMIEHLTDFRGIFKISGSYHNTQATYKEFITKCKTILDLKFLGMITFMYNSKNNNINKLFALSKAVLSKEHVEISPLISSSVKELPTVGEESPFYEIEHIFKNENIDKISENSYIFQSRIPVRLYDGSVEYVSRALMWHRRCNSFSGFQCNVSKERCIIDFDGKVYKCFNDMFSSEKRSVLDILSENFDCSDYFENLKPMLCDYNKCFFELEHKKYLKE